MADDKFPFPIISFARFLAGNKEEQEATGKKLYDAFHNYGWAYLKDFGISQQEIDESFRYVRFSHSKQQRCIIVVSTNGELKSEKFFAMPMEEKMKIKVTSPTYSQGYTPDGVERITSGKSHKECYEHRRVDNSLCYPAGEVDGFREFADSFYQVSLPLGSGMNISENPVSYQSS